jgi:peptidoglycan hydrolase-like protein with peptidoglycan-binding domain
MCKENRGDMPKGEYYYKTCGGMPKEAYLVLFGVAASAPRTGTAKPLTEAAVRTVTVGPAFDCAAARQPLAQMLCTDPELARLDIRFGQAYWVLYQQLGAGGQRALKEEDAAFLNSVQQQCAIPKSGPLTPEALQGRGCVEQSYENQRTAWFSRLNGAAAEEAVREPERHIALQVALRSIGFLAPADMLDGVYGSSTRTAIATWQRSHNRPPTAVLGNDDAALLEREAADRSAGRVAQASKPERSATANIPAAAPGEGLTIAVIPERTDASLVIKGEIKNETNASQEVPKLRVAIRDASETELAMKVVNPPLDHLDAGAIATFEASFEPNDQAAGVAVSFLASPPKPSLVTTAPPDSVLQINALLADIYAHYPRATGRNVPPPWRMPYAAQIFDPPMVALLVEEHRLASGPDGGIVAFDADPFCDCQDDEGMRPSVGDIQITGPITASAKIDLRWMCAVSQSPRLTPADRQRLMSNCWREHQSGVIDSKQLAVDLTLVGDAWRIQDIHSPNIKSLHDHIIQAIALTKRASKKQ